MKVVSRFLTLATAVVVLAPAAHALPLFAESAALQSGSALTLYPDHLDPNKFYFMPNSSKIGRDSKNVPTFSFTYYGLDSGPLDKAGALMVYVGRLTSDPDQAAAMTDFLKTHPSAGIAVLPIKESTIGLSTTADGGIAMKPLFSEFNFSQKGGRAEDEIGINALLTGVGAKIFKASLKSDPGAAFKYDMCYKVVGLGPSMDGTIDVDMDRVYDHFAASASGGTFWWRATISTEIEKLVTSHNIKWTINGGDAKDEDYIKEATRQIVERMFKPELAMNAAGTQTVWDNLTPFSFGGSYVHKEELAHEHWSITRRLNEELEFCVPLVIKDIQDNQKKCVIDADAN